MKRSVICSIAVALVAGCGGSGPASQAPTSTPVVTAAPASGPLLARGTFKLYGVQLVLDAAGSGSSVSGSLTMKADNAAFRVDLKCSQTTADGVLLIAGDIVESTSIFARKGAREVIVLKPGSPVHAAFDSEGRDGGDVLPAASCPELLEQVIKTGTQTVIADGGMEPIEGTVEFGP